MVLEYQSAKFAGTLIVVQHAGVTELADVLDLGSSVLSGVGVQISSPAPKKVICGSDSVVECDLAKVEVAGSNPVFRSTPFKGEQEKAESLSKTQQVIAGVAQW